MGRYVSTAIERCGMDKRLDYVRATLSAPTEEGGELKFTASAEGVNRYGFSLKADHWRLDNFNANPVILWMHNDHMPPIGRGRVTQKGRKLDLAVTFDRSDPLAAEIERKYREGFMSAVSVGFDFVDAKGSPIKNWYNLTAEQIANEAYYDLAEVSAVPIPADPKALIQQRYALCADFGLIDPDDRPTLNAIPVTHTINPVYGSLSDRLTKLEEIIGRIPQLSAGPVETDPEETDEIVNPEEYDEQAVQELLAAIQLSNN